jgi:hypothetical protein
MTRSAAQTISKADRQRVLRAVAAIERALLTIDAVRLDGMQAAQALDAIQRGAATIKAEAS